MDLENQQRVKDLSESLGAGNIVVVLGAAEGEAAGIAAETLISGDPTYAGPLTNVPLGLTVYHICEEEIKKHLDPAAYDTQVGMMEMVLNLEEIASEMQAVRS
jgi:betaine reductase